MLTYEAQNTYIHNLNGLTKLIFFLIWSMVGMLTYDTRILLFMFGVSIIIFKSSAINFKKVQFVFSVVGIFLVLNLIFIYLFAPQQGYKIYGSATVIYQITPFYQITLEQLFYEFNIALKYATIVPAVTLFVLTTNPSEFAASLNKIGVSYKISYAVALAMRYIPTMQKEFIDIKNSQEARGIDMSKQQQFFRRIQNMASIIMPLLFSSMDRINVVSNAMLLRGFGKAKHRTWYAAQPLTSKDGIIILTVIGFAVISLMITFHDGNRFYNPFLA